MGADPDPDEVPPEWEDLTLETQSALEVFSLLPDTWDGMSGAYLGKNLTALDTVFSMLEIDREDRLLIYTLFLVIQETNASIINTKNKEKASNDKNAKTS